MLREGEKAPNFELESDAHGTVRLKDYLGRQVILYFYPKDNTPGCTRQAVAFSEADPIFAKAGAVVIGVSKDSLKSHATFRDKHQLSIVLASDPELTAHHAYGAYGEKTMYGKKVMGTIRSTFVIDEAGTVKKVFPSVKVDGHVDAVVLALEAGSAGHGHAKALVATKAAKTAKPAKPSPKKAQAPAKR